MCDHRLIGNMVHEIFFNKILRIYKRVDFVREGNRTNSFLNSYRAAAIELKYERKRGRTKGCERVLKGSRLVGQSVGRSVCQNSWCEGYTSMPLSSNCSHHTPTPTQSPKSEYLPPPRTIFLFPNPQSTNLPSLSLPNHHPLFREDNTTTSTN